jgi:hexulose-6-phosphate isomerase
MNRRGFFKRSTTTAVCAAGLGTVQTYAADTPKKNHGMKKAVKFDMVQGDMPIREKFKLLKELGFDGVEMYSPSPLDREEVLAARDETGLAIPGVVGARHWKVPLSDPDPAIRAEGVKAMETGLRDAKYYGASTILLVPAVVKKEVPYEQAYRRCQEEIRKLIPLARELGVVIAIENVWNNFLLSPLEMARFIDEFESPFVKVYFDVGNILRYGWPEHWIRTLGKRIAKLDIKEYSLKKMNSEGLWKGFEVELLEGDCDWPAVMKALKDIGYAGWGTAEIPGGDRERLKNIAERMDRIWES